jgi:hypothetical protein
MNRRSSKARKAHRISLERSSRHALERRGTKAKAEEIRQLGKPELGVETLALAEGENTFDSVEFEPAAKPLSAPKRARFLLRRISARCPWGSKQRVRAWREQQEPKP